MTADFPAVPLSAYLVTSVLLALMLVLAVLAVWVLIGAARLEVSVEATELRVVAPFYGGAIPFRDIRPEGLAIVDLTRDRFVPSVRTNGIALPGLRLGSYRLASGMLGHVVVTTSTTALAVPLRDGSTWLLGVRDPERLRTALASALGDA